MSRPYRHKRASTDGRHFSMRDELAFNQRAIVLQLDNPGHQFDRLIGRRGPPQLDRVIGGHSAGRMIGAIALHQMISRGPVAVTIKQRPNDPATEHAGEGLLISLRLKLGNYLIAFDKAADVQTLFVGWTTSETGVVWGVGFLKTFFRHFDD